MVPDPIHIPGYENFRLIGRGGSAVVWQARQIQLERDVAIKVLNPGGLDDQTRRLFDAERKALGRLPKHPNLVTVFDSGFTAEGDPFLVMELCSAGSLSSAVKSRGPLALEQVVRTGLRIAEALEFAHEHGMIHRDVKPENILISDRGEPVLSDFGIAAILDQDGATSDGAMSPHHVAPEMLSGTVPSPSSDLYSLGSTLFFLLTGRTPHQRAVGERLSIGEVLSRVTDPHFSTEIPSDADASRNFRSVMRNLLQKEPRKRMANASEAIVAFANLETELGSARMKFVLPPTRPTPIVEAESDPDATIFGVAQTGGRQAPYVEPAKPSKPSSRSSVSLGGSSESHRVRTASPVRSQPDHDLTIVASGRSGSGSLPSIPTANLRSIDHDMEGVTPRPKRNLFVLGGIAALLLIAGVVFAVGKTAAPTAAEPTDAVVADLPSFDIVAPLDVEVKELSNDEVEVFWTPSNEAAIQYRVEVRDVNENPVFSQVVAAPPIRVKQLDLQSWTPCVVVVAVDPSAGIEAESERKCYESGGSTTADSAPEDSTAGGT